MKHLRLTRKLVTISKPMIRERNRVLRLRPRLEILTIMIWPQVESVTAMRCDGLLDWMGTKQLTETDTDTVANDHFHHA